MEVKIPAHIMLDYESKFQKTSFLVNFFKSGISGGGKCYYIVSEHTPYHALKLFDNFGFDVVKHTGTGALEIHSAEDTYLASGFFNPEKTLKMFLKFAEESIEHGYKYVYFAGDMTWASKNISEIGQLLRYEKNVNDRIENALLAAVCMYNKNFFTPEIINDLILLHPQRVSGQGKIIKNIDFLLEEKSVSKYIGKIIKKSGFFGQ